MSANNILIITKIHDSYVVEERTLEEGIDDYMVVASDKDFKKACKKANDYYHNSEYGVEYGITFSESCFRRDTKKHINDRKNNRRYTWKEVSEGRFEGRL